VDTLQDEGESGEARARELEEQLRERSPIEEKVDTLVKKERESNAPFVVKWYRWFKDRD